MRSSLYPPPENEFLVPYDGSFRIAAAPAEPTERMKKKDAEEELDDITSDLRKLQRKLYADDRYSLLLVFQAMDAAGKDGTIRAVMTGINPAGCQVFTFKAPSHLELDHDFLWRIWRRLPERGRIGIFNRSHYEEVLVVRVHPELLDNQKLPRRPPLEKLFEERYESIRDMEKHLARNGTVILKFFLNVSREEQKQRFLDRLERPDKNWKFSAADIHERGRWRSYMHAYEEMLNATSREWSPWYAIPADHKPTMRVHVARILRDTMAALDLEFPKVSDEERKKLALLRETLIDEP